MIMTRTPLRVSFIGGGSDFPDYFNKTPGYVLGTAVNLFVYTGVLAHSALADNKYKVSYRINESVDDISEIQHPLVRASLQSINWQGPGLHISTLADVPARTGLGSSSAFAVGLTNALNLLNGNTLDDYRLARESIKLEREILQEAGGWQDQCFSAYTGTKLFRFTNNDFKVAEDFRSSGITEELNRRMILISAGNPRDSTIHAKITEKSLSSKVGFSHAQEMANIAFETATALRKSSSAQNGIYALAEGINEGWKLKTLLSGDVSKPVLDLIDFGMQNGAIAAKLCGAGGSGFVLFLLGSAQREDFLAKFPNNRVQSIQVFEKETVGPDFGLVI